MIGVLRRALERRRAVRMMVEQLVAQMGAGAWKHARERASSAQTAEERIRWRMVQDRIEAMDDRSARLTARKRART